jgi:oligopeptidase B
MARSARSARSVCPQVALVALFGSSVLFAAACAHDSAPAPAPSLPRTPFLSALAASAHPSEGDAGPPSPVAPVARKESHETTLAGHVLRDDYFWLRKKDDPDVVAYLEAENAYTAAMTQGLTPLVDKVYAETISRIQETDSTAPVPFGKWLYYTRTEKGKQYALQCRKHGPAGTADKADSAEVVLLDPNEIAKTERFVGIGDSDVSDDGNLFAYGLDTTGFRQFTLHVKDLRTGAELPDRIPRVDSIAFAADGKHVFYVTEDAQTKRENQVHVHILGTDAAKDKLVYEEKDERFDVSLERSRSRDFIVVESFSKTTTEVRLVDARHPDAPPRVVEPRQAEHEYHVEPGKSVLYIRTNSGGRNFGVVTAPLATPERAHWKDLVPHRPDVMVESVEAFADHVVLRERKDATVTWRSLDTNAKTSPKPGASHTIAMDEKVYAMGYEPNREFNAETFRFAFSSPTTPRSVYEENVRTGARTLLKRDNVPGFDPTRYASDRIHVTARDGTAVPVSIVYPKGMTPDGTHPVYLGAYGSYGIPSDFSFNTLRPSLLDRGVICAVAHIRGGGDLGKPWHDGGRMATKMNTFTDFIDAAEGLIKTGWARKGAIAIEGGSAGGLLMGAVTNLRPDLWRAVVARVPFVDVLNTMADESLPLTTGEFEEWGNPKIPEQYGWMAAYSPYDNVTKKDYPPMLVESSYNDSQVMYWEPAKWVAKLRANKTDANPLFLHMNMKPAGHGGQSGRYDHMREVAFGYAFILHQLGMEGMPN